MNASRVSTRNDSVLTSNLRVGCFLERIHAGSSPQVRRVASVSATQGTTTVYAASYAYNQGSEHRGLPTSITYSGLPAAITATYDGDGALVTQTLPQVSGGGGTITQAWARDPAGNTTAMEYTQAGLPFGVSDTVEVDPAGRWAGESQSAGSWTRDYSYDPAGRLIGVTHDDGVSCVTHTYGFDVNSNRTATGSFPDAGGATPTDICQSTTGTVSSSAFSAADRPTTLNGVNVASTYDAFGRTTSLAAALAPSGTAVSSIGYYVNDLVRTMTSAGVNKTWTLDGAGRLACQRSKPTTTTDSSACGATTTASVVDTVNHYLDASSDSPAWTLTNTAGTPTIVSYFTGFDGTLIAELSGSTIDYQLASIHGDIVATCSTSAAGSYDGTTITADEYGNTDVAARYAWLGGKQRSQDGSAGLILMGVRLYNTVTGLFLTPDPIRGGNDNSYGYPVEPLGRLDLRGMCWGWGCEWISENADLIMDVATFAAAGVCIAFTAGACAVAVSAAFVIRTAVRLSRDEGLTDANSRVIMADAIVTAMTAGISAGFRAGTGSMKDAPKSMKLTTLAFKMAKHVVMAPYVFSNHFYNKHRELW